MSSVIDISMPIYNDMWRYRPEWTNKIEAVISTKNGDNGTVYNFNLHSHTGTYIETSQHKINNDVLLRDFSLETFFCKCKLLLVSTTNDGIITLQNVLNNLNEAGLSIVEGDNLIISTGWGLNFKSKDFISESPSFEPELMNWIIEKQLKILGVDTPSIENFDMPFQPVNRFFENNENGLLLAPLKIDTSMVTTKEYTLCCLPAFSAEISGCLTRAVLITS